jgi:CrcB protein
MLTPVLPIALGGALGAVLRYLALLAVPAPWGTLAINAAGSFLIGLLFVPAGRMGVSPFLLTGVLGGFTTFSAFSLDALRLWTAGQGGQALAYVAASVALSLAGVALGAWAFQAIGGAQA